MDNRSEASYPDYLDWRARNTTFSGLAGYTGGGFLLGGAQPSTIGGSKVTANFFDVIGVRPILGRAFVAGEDAVGAPRVAMLAHGFWLRQFAGDRGIVGKTISLNGAPTTVVGVLPSDFQWARSGDADVWVPIDRAQRQRNSRDNHWLHIVARLKPGVTLATASKDMSAIMRDLATNYPESNTGRDALVVPLQDEFVGSVRPTLRLLYWAVIVVLLIACVNVANLLLIRGADRQREMAVRVALGAGGGRLVRQLLTESLVLAVVGGLLGLAVARVGVHSLVSLIPPERAAGLPGLASAGLDPRVVAYAMLVAIGAGLGFGLVPALRMSRATVHDTLKAAGRGTIGGSSRLRDGLVVGELALTVILMSGALLFGRSLVRLLSIDPGFRVQQLVTTSVVLPDAPYSAGKRELAAAAFARLTDALKAVPGIEAVGLTSRLPLDFGNSAGFNIRGMPTPPPGQTPNASYRQVSPDYFSAMGIPLRAGRAFTAGDDMNAPLVGLVNRTFVDVYLRGRDPVGQMLDGIAGDSLRIVGVVGDVPIGNIGDKIPPTLYVPFAKWPQASMALGVRTHLGLDETVRIIRQTVASIEPRAALGSAATMESVITESPSVFMRRFPLFLVGAFAVTALLLAVVGIYGVVSYSVAQRSREMGIRMALGAPRGSVMALVIRHGGVMALSGIVLGVVASLALGRFAESMLFGVRPSDPITHVSVAMALALIAVGATLIPARRATRVDPAAALRSDG